MWVTLLCNDGGRSGFCVWKGEKSTKVRKNVGKICDFCKKWGVASEYLYTKKIIFMQKMGVFA